MAVNLANKTFVVTGANAGLGLATSRALAHAGATVVMGCRDPGRAAKAADVIRASVPEAKLDLQRLDLASLASVAAFAQEVTKRHTVVHGLVNNAGLMATGFGKTTDGFEIQLGVNHLGHFALTLQLRAALDAAPRARVVNVASSAHHGISAMRWDDLMWDRHTWWAVDKWRAYSQSKLANLLFTAGLHRRASNWTVCAAHPGYAATELQTTGVRDGGAWMEEKVMALLNRVVAQSGEDGAAPQIHAATADDVEGNAYFGPRNGMTGGGAVPHSRSAAARDDAAAERLWAVSEELTGQRW